MWHWTLGDLGQLLQQQQAVGRWCYLSPTPPLLLMGWGGMGWDEWRDLGHFGLAEQGPHPTVSMPGSWMWQWGRFWLQEGARMPAQCQQAGWAAWGLCFLPLPQMPGATLATPLVLLHCSMDALCPASVAAVVPGWHWPQVQCWLGTEAALGHGAQPPSQCWWLMSHGCAWELCE